MSTSDCFISYSASASASDLEQISQLINQSIHSAMLELEELVTECSNLGLDSEASIFNSNHSLLIEGISGRWTPTPTPTNTISESTLEFSSNETISRKDTTHVPTSTPTDKQAVGMISKSEEVEKIKNALLDRFNREHIDKMVRLQLNENLSSLSLDSFPIAFRFPAFNLVQWAETSADIDKALNIIGTHNSPFIIEDKNGKVIHSPLINIKALSSIQETNQNSDLLSAWLASAQNITHYEYIDVDVISMKEVAMTLNKKLRANSLVSVASLFILATSGFLIINGVFELQAANRLSLLIFLMSLVTLCFSSISLFTLWWAKPKILTQKAIEIEKRVERMEEQAREMEKRAKEIEANLRDTKGSPPPGLLQSFTPTPA